MKISMLVLACGLGAICSGVSPVRAQDADLDARLREALRQKMSETSAPPAAPAQPAKPVKVQKPAPQPVKSAVPPAKPAATAPTVSAPAKAAPPAPAPAVAVTQPAIVTATTAASDDAQAEQLREALRAKMAAEAANPPTPPAVVTPPAPSKPTAPRKTPVVVIPLPEPPPSSLPATKEARLAQLLQQYKADQITPEQYHLERAKIIAEP
jgi:hypothetical protein